MFHLHGITFSQQFRNCSKPNCKCQDGEQHGPYWYARGDTIGLKYLGKELPEEVTTYQSNLKLDLPLIEQLTRDAQERRERARRALDQADEDIRALTALVDGYQAPNKNVLQRLGLERYALKLK
jgi:hypothetical protein